VRDIEMEIERYRAKSKGGSLMPLTCALAALQALEPRKAPYGPELQSAVTAALALVRDELHDVLETSGGPILRSLDSIR
jgi:hypothetical protein